MSVIQVASRYASALLEEAQRLNVVDEVFNDMKTVQTTVSESRELTLMLKSPIVNSGIKQSSLRSIFDGKVSTLTSSFLSLLVKKRREAELPHIVDAFFEAYNAFMNIVEVSVVSAVELSPALEDQIISSIQGQLGDVTLQIKKSIDPSLLGGFVVKVGDRVFDTSLHHKLKSLKREILAS